MILFAFLIYFAKIIGGFMLAHLLWPARDIKALLLKFFMGVGLGTGVASLLYFLWLWFKLPLPVFGYVELLLLILLGVLVFIQEKSKGVTKPLMVVAPSKSGLLWGVLVMLALFVAVSSFLLRALRVPHGVQDAWGIWNVSARFIYGAGERWLQIIPQNAWFHPDYPLLVSLNIAEVWSILGVSLTRVPIILALVYMLGLLGLLASALAIVKDQQQGALGMILLACLPVVPSLASNQYADLPLAYFFLGTAALLYIYTILRETRLLLFAGLFAGLTAWTKNEGLTFIAIATLSCFLLGLSEKRNLLKYFLAGLGLPLFAIVLFKSVTPTNDLYAAASTSFWQLLDFSRTQVIISAMLRMFLSFGGWPISFAVVLAVYAILMFGRYSIRGKIWLLFAAIVCQLIAYFGIYLFTPADVTVHMNTSLERLVFHLFPLTIFLVLSLLPSPREVFASDAV